MKDNIVVMHSGDCGDLIAFLSTCKELYEKEGRKTELLVDITGGIKYGPKEHTEMISKQTQGFGLKLKKPTFDFMYPLLAAQPYIDSVKIYDDERDKNRVHIWGNKFRTMLNACKLPNGAPTMNLEHVQRKAVTGEDYYKMDSWLVSEKADVLPKGKDCVWSRSLRMQSAGAYITEMGEKLSNKFVFIGTDLEYECTKEYIRYPVERFEVKSAMDMLNAIASAKIVFCNSTLTYWLAVGLGKKEQIILLESPINLFTALYEYPQRPNIYTVTGYEISAKPTIRNQYLTHIQ